MILPATHRFEVGDVIKHLRYGYRGIIVDVDETCRADEEWYQHNQTQPDRLQPWYHVLVHQATHTTYVAESNLDNDSDDQPIVHPLLSHFFDSLEDGGYRRNSQPWNS